MKLSVSVPDALWIAAKVVSDTDSPSEVVQQALRLLVSSTPMSDAQLRAAAAEYFMNELETLLNPPRTLVIEEMEPPPQGNA